MSTHANRVKMTVTSVASSGTGDITLNAASTGFRSFATAYSNANATVDILITEGSTWEIARNCTYTHSGTTVSRGTLENSSTGSAVVFTSAAVVSVIAPASFGNAAETVLGSFGALDGENSITGTATAVIGRLNVCSGTSADYTVTLPAVSGNAGKYIGFQMAPGLTKLVTLDGNSTETIDGATTRIMWAGETAILLCDGSNWFKVAGKSKPMACLMKAAATTSVANTTSTTVVLATVTLDNTGTMADNASSTRMYCRRTGDYLLTTVVRFGAPAATADASSYYYLNDTTDFLQLYTCATTAAAGANPSAGIAAPVALTAGDFIRLRAYHTIGSAKNALQDDSYMSLLEQPSW